MTKASAKKTGNFEQALKRLESIVETLEQGTASLDEAMSMYEEGVQLSKQCLEKLTQAELRLKQLSKDVNGNFELSEEDPEE